MSDTSDYIRHQVQMYAGQGDDQMLAAIRGLVHVNEDEVCDLQLVAADILFDTAQGSPEALREAGHRYKTYLKWAERFPSSGPEVRRVLMDQKFGRYVPQIADIERAKGNLVACEKAVGPIATGGAGCLVMLIPLACAVVMIAAFTVR